MTDSDLRDAREAVTQRSESQRQRSRRRALAAVAAAAVVVPVLGVTAFRAMDGPDDTSGPASPAPASPDSDDSLLQGIAPTAELVQGVWRVDNGTTLVRFSSSNEFSIDDTARLFSDPLLSGTYAIDGDLVTVSVDAGPVGCVGQTIDLRTSLPEAGYMRMLQPRDSTCTLEQGGQWLLEQMLPLNDEYRTGFAVPDSASWTRLAGAATLHGVWVPVRGGHLLEIDPGGAYYVADKSGDPIERGQWTLRDQDLSFSPSADSNGCSKGDRIVLAGVEQIGGGTTNIRAAGIEITCVSDWAESGQWFLLPDASIEP